MTRKVIPLNNHTHQIPLLQAKLLAPHTLSGLVARPRVSACLDASLQGKLTLVTAPAGFGKTTAVAEWVRQRDLPVAWLSLDSGDNDPVRFWSYLAAALGGLQPRVGAGLEAMLRSSTDPPWETTISLLIDDLAAAVPFDFALVLDDYHVITEPLIHNTFFFFVRYAPERRKDSVRS
jgi:LuxR family maltose regulon positive regulatory protein